jgi:GTP-binding protein
MADIPGLIEGASEGAGLGDQFLRHVERCRVLLHVVDLSAQGEGRDPVSDWKTINRELEKYKPELAKKPQLIVANKIDLPFARERLPAFVKAMKRRAYKVFPISAATGEGLPELLDATVKLFSLPEPRRPSPLPDDQAHASRHR